MSLHDRIAELQCLEGYSSHVKHGFLMAQNEAYQLAKEADELMAEMARALRAFSHYPKIGKLCEEYDNWKETTK